MQTCSKCGVEKDESQFHRDPKSKTGLSYHCKPCKIETAKAHHLKNRDAKLVKMRERHFADKERNNAISRAYRLANKEKCAETNKAWRKKKLAENPDYKREEYLRNREKRLSQQKAYRKENRDSILAKHRAYRNNPEKKAIIARGKLKCYNEKRRSDPGFRILCNIRKRIYDALMGRAKSARTIELMGCSVEEFKAHIEKHWQPGMSWTNYGEWELDHERPCASFNLELESEQRACFGYQNTKPMWWWDNIQKSDSLPTPRNPEATR